MPRYHLFYMSCEDARRIDSAIFEAPDEGAAVALIAEGDFAFPLELWSGYDQIKRFECSGEVPRVSVAART